MTSKTVSELGGVYIYQGQPCVCQSDVRAFLEPLALVVEVGRDLSVSSEPDQDT